MFEEYLDSPLFRGDPIQMLVTDGSKLKFESFLELFKGAQIWNYVLFGAKKHEYLKERRATLEKNDRTTYLKLARESIEKD